jgi:hypothetical protein
MVVEGTRVLPLPSMEPTRRQPKDPQERPQWDARAGLIDGAQDLPFGEAVWQPLPRQGESGGSVYGEHEPKQRRELLDASSEQEDLLSEFRVRAGGHVKTDDNGRRRAEPPACRRTRDTEIRREVHIPGAVDEISQSVVIPLLRADRARHAEDHQPVRSRPSTPPERDGTDAAVCRSAV